MTGVQTCALPISALPPLGLQVYEYPGVPPLTDTLAEPFEPPLQVTLVVLTVSVAHCASNFDKERKSKRDRTSLFILIT